jgi:hypothetical protein
MPTAESSVRDRPTSGELQDDIMRFEGRFSSRLVTAFEPLVDSSDLAVRHRAARDELDFMSAALDIAVGSEPEVDLLDMVTLVALGRDAMARRWDVDVHGGAGRAVVEAFDASIEDISAIAHSALPADIEDELGRVIVDWQREHPEQLNVSAVRLSAHAKYRSTSSGAVASRASGLFSAARAAAKTADSAVLLGERALYASQRLPLLVRMHARVAAGDLALDLRRKGAATDQVRAIVASAESSTSRILFRAFLSFSGFAIVAATSWLIARMAHRRLL